MDPASQQRRKTIRMKGYDYSLPGCYFVTVVVHNRLCLFGDIANDCFTHNAAGIMIERWWHELPKKFPSTQLDAYVVMPNHFHGILCLSESPGDNPPVLLSTILQWWKTMTTNAYITGVKTNGWEPFQRQLWQRSFYDRVIRSDDELQKIRQYVENNSLTWKDDRELEGVL